MKLKIKNFIVNTALRLLALKRNEAIYIYAMGVCEDLIDKNILIGEKNLTKKGKFFFVFLKFVGFEPTEKEINYFMASVFSMQ